MDGTNTFLSNLANDVLLASTRKLVARNNQTLAALLAHLGEVEARGLHRERACTSLYTYCIYELRMSEDAASRRARAARLCREYPALLERVATGELHLTGLLLIGPHLTPENQFEVLERAKHRSKKETLKLVRQLDPLPDAPACVEPLGPAAGGIVAPRAPSWGEWWTSLVSARDLEPGDRPRDWMGTDGGDLDDTDSEPAPARAATRDEKPQRYKVQFTVTDEYVALLERAKDLLSHTAQSERAKRVEGPEGRRSRPGPEDRSLEAVHLRALQTLVAELEKRRFGVGAKARSASTKHAGDPRQRGSTNARSERAATTKRPTRMNTRPDAKPSRHIPAAVRREVWERDEGRCTYVDARGQRCRETAMLEMHHEEPFARGGPPTTANVALRCRCHNRLAAEDDFGRDFMERKVGPPRHASR